MPEEEHTYVLDILRIRRLKEDLDAVKGSDDSLCNRASNAAGKQFFGNDEGASLLVGVAMGGIFHGERMSSEHTRGNTRE